MCRIAAENGYQAAVCPERVCIEVVEEYSFAAQPVQGGGHVRDSAQRLYHFRHETFQYDEDDVGPFDGKERGDTVCRRRLLQLLEEGGRPGFVEETVLLVEGLVAGQGIQKAETGVYCRVVQLHLFAEIYFPHVHGRYGESAPDGDKQQGGKQEQDDGRKGFPAGGFEPLPPFQNQVPEQRDESGYRSQDGDGATYQLPCLGTCQGALRRVEVEQGSGV